VEREKLVTWWAWSLDRKNWVKPANPTNPVTEAKAASGNVETMAHLLLARPAADKDAAWVPGFREHLVKLRDSNGVWQPGGQLGLGRRPPRETQEVTTLWAQLALRSVAFSETPDRVFERVAKWLSQGQPGQSTEWWALQLLTHREFGRQQEADAARRTLLEQQNPDGGWGWLVGEPSDAFGTGLALYALRSRRVDRSRPAGGEGDRVFEDHADRRRFVGGAEHAREGQQARARNLDLLGHRLGRVGNPGDTSARGQSQRQGWPVGLSRAG
jgi:squalene-hopene/tetraprenyl-beta-curcumene cyclase